MKYELTCPVCGRPLEKPPTVTIVDHAEAGATRLDSDLRRVRFAFRAVAGLNGAMAAALFTKGDYPQSIVCVLVGLMCGMMAFNVHAHQRTRDEFKETMRQHLAEILTRSK